MGDLNTREWFLDQTADDDVTLSERITRLDLQEIVIEYLRLSMKDADRLTSMVSELKNYTTEEDIAGPIRAIEQMARKIMAGDMSEFSAFKKALSSAKSDLLADIPSKLDRAYLKVVRAAESLNSAGLDNAIEYALDKKAAANAFRIATTEISKAYNLGVYDRAQDDDDVVAMQVDLSSNENNCEDCIQLADHENGAGPGIYSLDDCPVLPLHPHCRCMLTPVYRLPEGIDPEDIDSDLDFDAYED